MSHTLRQWLLYGIAIAGAGGVIFNIVQIVIIINGNYNRNPDITIEWLQTLDAIGLTLLWLLVSIVMVLSAVASLRQND